MTIYWIARRSKGFNLLNIRTKKIFIERSVKFDEPLQEVELVEENSIDLPSRSADNLGDKSGSDESDFAEIIYEIIQQEILDSEPYSEVQTNLPTWANKTLSSIGENIGNPTDPRRTRFEFERSGIAISCHDYLLSNTCSLKFRPGSSWIDRISNVFPGGIKCLLGPSWEICLHFRI